MRHQAARLAAIGALLAFVFSSVPATGQAPAGEPLVHVVIPFLASATSPSDLGFEGAECERNPASSTMECQFQQVFLTTSDVVPDTCLVTTNRYQRVFQKQSSTLWTSTQGPTGECEVLDVVTLQDDGGVRWTMTIRKTAGRTDTPACRVEEASETFGWQNLRRPLPCRFVQPGGLSR